MIINASLLLAADAGNIIPTQFHLARRFKVMVERTLLALTVHIHTATTLHPFSRTTWVSRYQKGKTSLGLNEARDDGVLRDGSGIKRTICKQTAPRCRQITTPTPHHSNFLQARCSS